MQEDKMVDKKEIDNFTRQIILARNEVNKEQEELRKEHNFVPPQYVAHATHVSQEEFKKSPAADIFSQHPENTDLVPAFSKGTQNEFNSEKIIKSRYNEEELKELEPYIPEYPKRVFAITTKQDDKGNPILDEHGIPIPQDGSYAYSLKKCCASINMVDGELPLLIGFEDKYADFENGRKIGHIYIGEGKNFRAEYDDKGNITEYTSDKEMVVTHHYETTPKEAMEHNVQLVIFDTKEHYNQWAAKVHESKKNFETFISSNDTTIKFLQEEISAGRATYINATERGLNPKITSLQNIQNITKLREAQKLRDMTNTSKENQTLAVPAGRRELTSKEETKNSSVTHTQILEQINSIYTH